MKITVYDFNKITGSNHKRVGINEVIQDALDDGVDTMSVISSGNYRDAILEEMRRRHVEDRLNLINLVNRPFDMPEIELETRGTILKSAKERARYVAANIFGSGKVKDYTDFVPKALEIEAEKVVQSNPDYVALGIGSGKLFVTLYRKIKERGLKTRLIGILPQDENAILHEGNFRFKSLADKLTAPFSAFKDEVLQAQSEGHMLYEATEGDFKIANKAARNQGLNSEISGSAGFVLYDEQVRARCGIKNDSKVVIVNTGCGDKKVRKMPLYVTALKPVLALAASILITLGANRAIDQCRIYNSNRAALTSVADMASRMLRENPDLSNMSNSELNAYIHNCKGRVGGPHNYFL